MWCRGTPGRNKVPSANIESAQFGKNDTERRTIVGLVMFLHPESRGEVMLRSADPRDHPLVYTGYFMNKIDLENVIQYVKDYIKIVNTSYFRKGDAIYVDLAYEKCGGFDFSGTCSMGSVVDSILRVYDVTGLRVIDASVIPQISSIVINAPVMMIAEKASDMIKKDNDLIDPNTNLKR